MSTSQAGGVAASPPTGGAGDLAPFRWVAISDLARGCSGDAVRFVVADELRRGRIESDGNGRVRLRTGALPGDLVRALAAIG